MDRGGLFEFLPPKKVGATIGEDGSPKCLSVARLGGWGRAQRHFDYPNSVLSIAFLRGAHRGRRRPEKRTAVNVAHAPYCAEIRKSLASQNNAGLA
jgi:hypothetical protein